MTNGRIVTIYQMDSDDPNATRTSVARFHVDPSLSTEDAIREFFYVNHLTAKLPRLHAEVEILTIETVDLGNVL